ncbi:MAG: acyltransferase [Zoogloea sp.]|nr:acyltransferase [Zoogloea sp.]
MNYELCLMDYLKRKLEQLAALPWNVYNLQFHKNFGKFSKINGKCKLTKKTFLGRNCHFNGIEIEGRGVVRIGNNFHSGKECLIITDVHDYDHGDALPYGKGYLVRNVLIGDNVWLGSRVIILGGVTIGDSAIVQAGAVVTKDVEPLAIVGGSPARKFKERDAGHYYSILRS